MESVSSDMEADGEGTRVSRWFSSRDLLVLVAPLGTDHPLQNSGPKVEGLVPCPEEY